MREVDLLRTAYTDLSDVAVSLDEAASWAPTGCAGWAARDLVFHLLGDAQRALVALGTPASDPADRDRVSYWTDAPGQQDPDSRGLRATRTMASAWTLSGLVDAYAETTRAVVVLAGRAEAGALVSTQGHVLRVDDLLDTLVVEAGLHHLDLVLELDRPGPSATTLAAVRATLDARLGRASPAQWDDATWARLATGRARLDADQSALLGDDVDRLPLIH
jgi:Mycothiol maleylpyruvate isomerase N-terminal domain